MEIYAPLPSLTLTFGHIQKAIKLYDYRRLSQQLKGLSTASGLENITGNAMVYSNSSGKRSE